MKTTPPYSGTRLISEQDSAEREIARRSSNHGMPWFTNETCCARRAAAERASIVTWLRRLAEQDGLSNEVMGAVAHLAVSIERGEHAQHDPEKSE